MDSSQRRAVTAQNQRRSAHAPKTPRLWAREYLPGYTGHVPNKNELFGKTAGTINKEICEAGGQQENLGRNFLKAHINGASQALPASSKQNKDVFGNWSKYARNWISGPTHEIRMQHVPGYTGQFQGVVDMGTMSKSYAKVSAHMLARSRRANSSKPTQHYMSSQRFEYKPNNFRRFAENKQMMPIKDYDDYTKFVNEQHNNRKSALIERTMRAQTTKGASRPFNHAQTQSNLEPLLVQAKIVPKSKQQRNFSLDLHGGAQTATIKPRMLESRVSEKEDFYNLSSGFKKIFGNDKIDRKMIIPVVGYGGHRRGDRSQNYFGKSFRDTTIQSKSLERSYRSHSLTN